MIAQKRILPILVTAALIASMPLISRAELFKTQSAGDIASLSFWETHGKSRLPGSDDTVELAVRDTSQMTANLSFKDICFAVSGAST